MSWLLEVSLDPTERTSKLQTDSEIESRLPAVGRGCGGGGVQEKRKRTPGMDSSAVMVGGGVGRGADSNDQIQ